jgi:hypothetical protein
MEGARRGRRQRETVVKAKAVIKRGRRLNSLTFPFLIYGAVGPRKKSRNRSKASIIVCSQGVSSAFALGGVRRL